MTAPAPSMPRLAAPLLAALFLAAWCLLPACRQAPPQGVEISWATNPHFTRFAAIRQFERENPGIRVKVRPISEPRQFLLQCLFGDAPDVITFFQVDSFQAFAKNNLLLPIPEAGYEPWPFYPGLAPYCRRFGDQALMALPQVAYPYLLFFNRDLVTDREAQGVKTWQGLLSLIQKRLPLAAKNGKPVFGLDIQSDAIWFHTWYWQRGGRVFAPASAALALDQSLAASALAAMGRWRALPDLLPRPQDRLNLPSHGASQGVLGSLFLQGRAMFYWSGSWKIWDLLQQDQVKWGIMPLPAGPANGLTLLGGNSFGVSARSRHPKQALRLVRHLASREGQQRHTALHIYMPARPDCPVPPEFQIPREQIGRARTLEYSPRHNEALVGEIMKQALQAHRLGRLSAAQAAAAMGRGLATGAVEALP